MISRIVVVTRTISTEAQLLELLNKAMKDDRDSIEFLQDDIVSMIDEFNPVFDEDGKPMEPVAPEGLFAYDIHAESHESNVAHRTIEFLSGAGNHPDAVFMTDGDD